MPCTGQCTWTFRNGSWTITQSNCSKGCVCAQGMTEAQSAAGSGFSVPMDKFRDELNKAFQLANGFSVDVISKNLTLANGTTYVMDCV
jgi:hypothetical protein